MKKGRKVVDTYREAHRDEIHAVTPALDHTPFIEDMVSSLWTEGYLGINDFFEHSQETNVKVLGYTSSAELIADCIEPVTGLPYPDKVDIWNDYVNSWW